MNPAEEFTQRIARKTFLSMWTYANPQGKNGKELCDLLVVCHPHVLIVSVKEIGFKDTGNVAVDWERWKREAVQASVKQIYGAERWIKQARTVIRHDRTAGLELPAPDEMRLHRMAIALGSKGEVPISFGDFEKGFVHVLTDESLEIVLSELDTVTDLTSYLSAKERWTEEIDKVIVAGGEENLLALYLHNNAQFPQNATHFLIDSDMWEGIQGKPEFTRKKEADRISYLWDRIIEEFSGHALAGTLETGNSLTEAEELVRAMARENRFQRRVLAKALKEFMLKVDKEGPMSRIVPSDSGIIYVFLAASPGISREWRKKELLVRCYVARGLNKNATTVVGIGTELLNSEGRSFDGVFLHHETWTDDNERQMKEYQRNGIFANPTPTPFSEQEYPPEESPEPYRSLLCRSLEQFRRVFRLLRPKGRNSWKS